MRKQSYKTKYIVGVVIGCLSLLVILSRNIYILATLKRFDPEIIPLQVCHFGNIMVFISLVFRSKIATAVAWCLNLFAAYASLLFADALAALPSVLSMMAQVYIWGHLFIVVGALYAVVMKIVRVDYKSYLAGIGVIFALLIPAIVLNSYFRDNQEYEGINYFYIYDPDGVPYGFLYIGERAKYGWFTINWIYTILVIILYAVLLTGIFFLQKLFYLKDKDYVTHYIFYELLEKKKAKAALNAVSE